MAANILRKIVPRFFKHRSYSTRCSFLAANTKSLNMKLLDCKNPHLKLQVRFLRAEIQDNIVYSPFDDVEMIERSLSEHIFESMERWSDDTALVCAITGRSYTYKEVIEYSKRFGSALIERGFKEGDVLCISSSNCPEYPIVCLATLAAGGVVTTSNPSSTVDELTRMLKLTKAKFLVCDPTVAPICKMAAENLSVKEIIALDSCDGISTFQDLISFEDVSSLSNITPVKDAKNAAAFILFSSGTTGLPKGVVLTHYNALSNLQQANGKGQTRGLRGSIYLGLLPLFHIYGLSIIMNCLFKGTLVPLLPNFSPQTFLETLSKYEVTHLFLVPFVLSFLIKHPMVENYDLSKLKSIICSGSSLNASDSVMDGLKVRIPNAVVSQGFGMTEMSPMSHNHSEEPMDFKSIGYPAPQTISKVVDMKTGEPLPPGEDGELVVKGPQIMKCYLDNEEATKAIKTEDGWLHTGDIANYDADGKFYISGRIKELIKYKSFQVSPIELETLLSEHPGVQESGVFGIPDDSAGQLPAALICLKQSYVGKLTEDDIHYFLNEKVSSHKQLHGGVKFVDSLPLTPAGKLLRVKLLDIFTKLD